MYRVHELRGWHFTLRDYSGTLYFSIPDHGGAMDSVPVEPAQLAWLEPIMARVPGARRVWSTTWELDHDAMVVVEGILRDEGARVAASSD